MSRYIRHSIVSLEDGLEAIRTGIPIAYSKEGRAKIGGLRLKTFSEKGTCCAYCGLEASYFAIERCSSPKNDSNKYHMNLWGLRDGAEVLFTHDHIHARSLGGADDITNSVTACEKCNGKKAKIESGIANKYKKGRKSFSLDFDQLVDIVKTRYKSGNALRFWFIPETA